MREIDFRMWSSDKKGYFYDPRIVLECLINQKLGHVDYVKEGYTFEQFTGLKDKNGVKIYEGDILACKFHHRYVERISWKGKPDAICTVFYDFNGFRLMAKGEEDERYADFFDFLDNMEYKQQMHDLSLTHTEVISNIHEVSNETTM